MSLKILHGIPGRYNDVTQVAINCLMQEGHVKIPPSDSERCKLFGDHLYGVVKHIKVIYPEGYEAIYPQGATADLLIPNVVSRHQQWITQAQSLDLKKLEWINQNHRLSDNYLQPGNCTYQLILTKFIKPWSHVIELGGRTGTNTCVLATLLQDNQNLWTIEPEPKWQKVLQTHRDLSEFKFEIKDQLPLDLPTTQSISLVSDSGQRLSQTLRLRPDLLQILNLVVLVNDFEHDSDRVTMIQTLKDNNLRLVFQRNGGWGRYRDNFYEVYSRDSTDSTVVEQVTDILPKYYLSLVSTIQNDGRFLKEWMEFHLLVGIEHFFLYDNNSTDNTVEILQPYIQKGLVTYVLWTNPEPGTLYAREHGLQVAKTYSYWVAMMDSDEFVVPHHTNDLRSLLYRYEAYAALAINWQMFGTSGVEEIPSDKLMVECLTQSSLGDDTLILENKKYNTHIKSIINSRYTRGLCHQHFAFCVPGRHAVNSDYVYIPDAFSPICTQEVQINHYYYRDLKCLKEIKLDRRNRWLKTQKSLPLETLEYHLEVDRKFCVIKNHSMDRFLEPLRHRIFGSK